MSAILHPGTQIPADGDGLGITYEIIEGERVERNMGVLERSIANMLNRDLTLFVTSQELGRTFVEMTYRMLPHHPITIPDVSFVSFLNWPDRRSMPRDKEAWHFVPNLAAEVISPNDKMSEAIVKLRRYFEAGVQSVWHVMPFIDSVYVYESPTRINVFSLGDDLVCPTLFRDWKMPLAALFPQETDE